MISNVLGIESSCDETAAAIIKDGKTVLSNIVSSQINIHGKYGGVVPELASRNHVEKIIPVIDEALSQAELTLNEIDGIAVTNGPGLVGSLLVGLSTAKAISYSLNIPFVGINHLEGHISVAHLEYDVNFPYIGLIASGGHTTLYFVKSFTDFQMLGKTRDDAAGEAFDKAAKLLGLGYPGGAEIDRVSLGGNPNAIKFPRPLLQSRSLDFSFSGIKTSLVYYLKKHPRIEPSHLKDICAGFQEAIAETLVEKTLIAAREKNVKNVVVAGGVACNTRLREIAKERFGKEEIDLLIPSPHFCTDNAAMIATLGYHRLLRSEYSDLNLNPFSTERPKYIRGKGMLIN